MGDRRLMKSTHALVAMGLVAVATGLISLVSLADSEPPATRPNLTKEEIPAPVARALGELGVPLVAAPAGSP